MIARFNLERKVGCHSIGVEKLQECHPNEYDHPGKINDRKCLITISIWRSCFPRTPRRVFGIKTRCRMWAAAAAVSLKIGRGGFMSSSRRIFAVVVLTLGLLMTRATPSAAQAHGAANAHPTTFATAAPANTGLQNLPLTEPDNLPPPVLVTPLTFSPDYFPSFGLRAEGPAQEVVQPEGRVQERSEDRIQSQPKIGER
jgi:hypothetical protein